MNYFYKRVNEAGKTYTVEAYQRLYPVKNAIPISESELKDFLRLLEGKTPGELQTFINSIKPKRL